MPKPLLPMEPKEVKAPFTSPEHLFQVKWDGVRCLAYLETGNVTLFNRRQNSRTTQYPELVTELTGLKEKGVILDGEIVALDHAGRPSFRQVLKRDLLQSGEKAKNLISKIPVTYLVFDVLFHRGKSTCHLPLSTRQVILGPLLDSLAESSLIKPVENFFEDGVSLFRAVEEQNLEGIVAKKLSSPYLLGQKSNYWQKVKCWRRQKAVICGLLINKCWLRSVLVGAYEEDALIYIGKVSSGLTEEQRKLLLAYGKNNPKKTPPVVNPPAKPVGEIIWVEPELVMLVQYLEWTGDMKLRSPVLAGFLTESPLSCTLK